MFCQFYFCVLEPFSQKSFLHLVHLFQAQISTKKSFFILRNRTSHGIMKDKICTRRIQIRNLIFTYN